jgi:cyclic pyranopterin phosphate synthase
MPFDANSKQNNLHLEWNKNKLVTMEEMMGKISPKFNLVKNVDEKNAVAQTFKIEGYKGTIGFIASMTEPFCGGCNRVRLTADGNLKVCLFDNREVSLRDILRSGDENMQVLLEKTISEAIKGKKFAHAGMDIIAKSPNRSMVRIGG